MIWHAHNAIGDDRTLCGFADEGEARGPGSDAPPVYAQYGGQVTCTDCRRIIAHCKEHYSVDFRVLMQIDSTVADRVY